MKPSSLWIPVADRPAWEALVLKDRAIYTRLILAAWRGSYTHNLTLDEPGREPDRDVVFVVHGGEGEYYGFDEYGAKTLLEPPFDAVVTELKTFIHQLAKGNPNFLETLWLREEDYINIQSVGRYLISQREHFFSKYAMLGMLGSARSHLKKVQANQDRLSEDFAPKRAGLYRMFGYDVKAAAHCMRILFTQNRFLTTGQYTVWWEGMDRERLLAIKAGKVTYNKVLQEAESLMNLNETLIKQSKLPERVDTERVNQICVQAVKMALGLHY